MASITDRDKLVINAIFNPNYPLDFASVLPSDSTIPSQKSIHAAEVKRLEEEGVRLAEENRLVEAIECFSRAIELDPEQSSPFNNRAQAYSLQNNTQEAISDLNTAIALAVVDGNHRKVLCLALTQRGILNKVLGKDEDSLDDFKHAAELGSSFAKQQVLLSNPYAAACNQMLTKIMKQASSIP